MDNQNPRDEAPFRMPVVRDIAPGAWRRWLRKGWEDLRASPAASLFYGATFSIMGWLLYLSVGRGEYLLALMTGFLLVAPFLAVGIYDISRRRERGEGVQLVPTLTAWRGNAPAIGLYAVILALLLAAWIRVSVVVVALFFTGGMPDFGHLPDEFLRNPEGLVFLGAYFAAGFGFALLVFATSVVSIPMLLDRPTMDTLTAMIVSFNAVRQNFATMLSWSLAIGALTALGIAPGYLGLIITMPLIGHASWHAYRETIAPAEAA